MILACKILKLEFFNVLVMEAFGRAQPKNLRFWRLGFPTIEHLGPVCYQLEFPLSQPLIGKGGRRKVKDPHNFFQSMTM